MKKLISIAVAATALGSAGASAHVSEAEWKQFKAEFSAMTQRVTALEAENQRLREKAGTAVPVEDLSKDIAMVKAQNKSASWAESVKWSGDFRYRFEDIDEDGKDGRDRNRVRARAALKAKPSETTEVGLGLASGSDDPVSTNQTLGGSGSTKDINMDLAYFTWKGLPDTAVTLGKFSNPFYRVQKSALIWDGDYRPEGVSVKWAKNNLFASASYNFIESDTRRDDEAFWGLQFGASFDVAEGTALTASAKYLDIPVKGREALFDDDFFGNSTATVNGTEVFANDFQVINASLELAMSVADMPLSLYGDYIKNEDADDLDTGYILGVKLGKAKNKGSWQVQYQYQQLEADATLGLITDSDFAGGGTDGEGHKFSAKYAIDKKWYVGATFFDTSRGVDLGSDADYQRLQLDTGFKY